MSLSMRIFVGVDCGEDRLAVGLVGSQGILRGLTTTAPLLPDHLDTLGGRLHGMLRGLRGETNLRMKNFCGIGIGLPGRYVSGHRQDLEAQIKRRLNLAVYLDDREALAAKGQAWLQEAAGKGLLDSRINLQQLDLGVVYGAAKLVIDHAAAEGR